jgi:hypothetical protein
VPVSSPSYFPPNSSLDQVKGINAGQLATGAPLFLAGKSAGKNSTANGLIIIGDLAGSGGIIDPQSAGAIIIGDNAAAKFVGSVQIVTGSVTVIGFNALAAQNDAQGLVVIGDGAAQSMTTTSRMLRSVIIGSQVLVANLGNSTDSVIIGYNAGNQTSGFVAESGSQPGSVIIGSQANNQVGQQGNSSNVIIGFKAAQAAASLSQGNVLIGTSVVAAISQIQNCVAIGSGITSKSGIPSLVTSVGSQADCTGTSNIFIGDHCNATGNSLGQYNVILGSGGGKQIPGATNYIFNVETFDSAVIRGVLYGDMNAGNLIVGNTTQGTNRDFGGVPGTNMLKLINGTAATGATIIGGGYFYVLAGDLHWVDSAGLDTTLSGNVNFPAPAAGATVTTTGNVVLNAPAAGAVLTTTGNVSFRAPAAGDTVTVAPSVGTGALIATSAALTNNAGAQVATILNGPLAGNPTKWFPINDAGTIRNIPAW